MTAAERKAAGALLEREPALAVVRDTVAQAAAGTGGLVLIEGPAGIGKTAMLDAAAAVATGSGVRVLRARASDLEQEFAFGVARQLFEGLLAHSDADEHATLLQGAAALASPLFDLAPVAALGAQYLEPATTSGGGLPAAARNNHSRHIWASS